jgi:serpin B
MRIFMLVLLVVSAGWSRAGAEEKIAPSMAMAREQTQFALRLYRELAQSGSDNLFLSPFSISAALAMTHAGAAGETEQEMRQLLFPSLNPADVPKFYEALVKELEPANTGEGVAWRVANALWPQEGAPFRKDYLRLVEKRFRAGVYPLDFSQSEAARSRINRWVEEKTEDRIKDLIAPGVLDPMTRLVLVNAVYFKGDWRTAFNRDETRPLPFYPADGTTNLVATMTGKVMARHAERDDVHLLELPYRGDRVSMLIAVPREDDLATLEQSLTPSVLDRWEAALEPPGEIRVFLPTFTMTESFSLNELLSTLGMTLPFDETMADFSGMNGRTNDLYIGAAIHKAFVEVNEEGTEAAAATAVVMVTRAMMPRPDPVFRADRPFLFLIRDRVTGTVLFMGRVSDPVAP